MIKKIKIILILLLCIILIAGFYIHKNYKKIDYDYSKCSEEEIFFQGLEDNFSPIESDYNFSSDRDGENYVRITFIDTELNPIQEAQIEIFDDSQDIYIETVKANSCGDIALNNLEFNTMYEFKQTKTREGLEVDSGAYSINLKDEIDGFRKIIVNSDHKLTDEEEEKIVDKYQEKYEKNENNDSDITTYRAKSNEVIMEDEAISISKNKYLFYKDNLYRLVLTIVTDEPIKKDDGIYYKCTIRIPSIFIENCTIEPLDNNENKIKIMDLNYNERNKLKNGEGFYIVAPNYGDVDNVDFKLMMIFKCNGKRFKISKKVDLNINTAQASDTGKIVGTFYKTGTKENWVGGKVLLEKIESSGKTINIGTINVGSDGMITYYNVVAGTYRFTKIENKKIIDTKTFKVDKGKTTEIEF